MFNASWFFNRIHRINQSWTIALTGFQFRSPSLAHLSFKPLSLTAHSVHRDVFTVRQLLERCPSCLSCEKKNVAARVYLSILNQKVYETLSALHTSSTSHLKLWQCWSYSRRQLDAKYSQTDSEPHSIQTPTISGLQGDRALPSIAQCEEP